MHDPHRRSGRAFALALACLVAPLAASSGASAAPAPHVLFGALVNHTYTGLTPEQEVGRLEKDIGRKLAIDHTGFTHWTDAFPLARMRTDVAAGRLPMMDWKQTSSSSIASGSQDGLIRRRAQQLKALGGRVLLEFGAEMDRFSVSGTPAQYIAAWRQVRAVFLSVGATNVELVWCPTNFGFDIGRSQPYYPGNGYVSWVCADGYNWGKYHPQQGWRSFPEIFDKFLRWAKVTTGKRVIIGEWASAEGKPGQKASWLSATETQVKSMYPQIRALVYFDTIGSDQGYAIDWRAQSSASAFAAFKAFAKDPYYTKMG